MKQKYLIFIAFGILFVLIIGISLLSKGSLTNTSQTTKTLLPPTLAFSNSNKQSPSFTVSSPPLVPSPTKTPLSSFTSSLNTLYGNPNNQKPAISDTRTKTSKKINSAPTPTPDPLKNFLHALNTMFSFSNTPSLLTSQSPSPPTEQNVVSTSGLGEKVYYPQCNGPYDNSPMPNGCNICNAGCGPTSVAMILSSYIDTKYDPPTVVNLYGESGFEAGCKGSTIVSAQQILSQNGMKTTDINYYGNSSFDETVNDFKQYLNSGWTLLTLVKYAPDWGHFYWVVDVDENNTIWAYDPGDAKRPVPLNENSVEPAAKYMLAIGVKKG